jgi:hypothetical protein
MGGVMRAKMLLRRLVKYWIFFSLTSPAMAQGPTSRELVASAPCVDSAHVETKSIDVCGLFGFKVGQWAPRARFRAVYRAPNDFSLIVTDAADDTPLLFCARGKMFLYDPVGPTVYYSEKANFRVVLQAVKERCSFYTDFRLSGNVPHRILLDFRSVLQASSGDVSSEKATRDGLGHYRLLREYQNESRLDFTIGNMNKLTRASFRVDTNDDAEVVLDPVILNRVVDDTWFAFPQQEVLERSLPPGCLVSAVKLGDRPFLQDSISRAIAARATANRPGPPGSPKPDVFADVDFVRARENDKKLSGTLRSVIPPAYQTGRTAKPRSETPKFTR